MSFSEIIRILPIELAKRGRRETKFLGKIILVDKDSRPVRIIDYHQLWEQRVATHRHIVVLGMGYVGLTLALKLSEVGFKVSGVEIDHSKVRLLNNCIPTIIEPGITELLREQLKSNFKVFPQIPDDGDVFIIAVGTPVRLTKRKKFPVPDLTMIKMAARMVGEHINQGALVILRSTVPLGISRNLVLPIIEKISGLKGGIDFHFSFAPERTVEGAALSELRELPQIIGGINSDSVEATAALFRELTPNIIKVESLESAELIKLINNSFRDYKFAFSNYISKICQIYNINTYNLIRAANMGYPRDPIPFPSPGVGGPCLTKDPYILSLADNLSKISPPLISRTINQSMHKFVVDSVITMIKDMGKNPKECKVLVCGIAFKGFPETSDTRNSSPVEISKILQKEIGQLTVWDPVVREEQIRELGFNPEKIPDGFLNKDAVLFLNNHPSFKKIDVFEMARMLQKPAIVYDAWSIFRVEDIISIEGVKYMGLGFHRSKY